MIVEADVVEQVGFRLLVAGIARQVYPFGFQRTEEALHRRIVPTVSPPRVAGHDAMPPQQGLVVVRAVLAAAIRVQQYLFLRLPACHGHLQCGVYARHQAVVVPGVAAGFVEMVRGTEGHHRADAGASITLNLAGKQLLGDTMDSWHTANGHAVVDALFDKNRQDQVFKAKLGFLKQLAQRFVSAQAAWADIHQSKMNENTR